MRLAYLVVAAIAVPTAARAAPDVPACPPSCPQAPATAPAAASTTTLASPRANSAFDRPHVALEVSTGLRTPLGFGGATLIASPGGPLSLEVGAGLGATGPQLSALARVRVSRHWSLATGYSAGEFGWTTGGWAYSDYRKYWRRAHWANLELSSVGTFGNMQSRAFVGFSRMLPWSSTCVGMAWHDGDSNHRPEDEYVEPCSGSGGQNLLYVGVAVRFATAIER